ncbi:MAG: Fe-S protein assembly chaperone HscA [Alphaproteobacteria bacterium]
MTGLLQIFEPGQTPLPHADVTALGIDLGTTHSVVAVSTGQHAEAIHDAHGRAIIPSMVQFDGAEPIVGHDAKRAWMEGEPGVVASVKRLMGRAAGDFKNPPHGLALAKSEGPLRVAIGGREITPTEISADILRHLKHMAVDALGRPIAQAVITVPAYFDEAARTATKDAARLAGIEVLRLLNEPTAAALAYGLDRQAEGIVAVYDMGGGTFDISILKLVDNIFQVLATAGDTQLGGDDMDRAIADYVRAHAKHKGALSAAETGQLMGLSRQAKEMLTTMRETTITWGGSDVVLTRAHLDTLIAPLIRRSLVCCDAALTDAKLTSDAIGEIVLVGGATRMKQIKRDVEAFFGKAPLDSIDPDLTVAYGAAIQAEALTKGAEHLLLDVTPLSLGVETVGGIVEKIIYRNSPIPAVAQQEFTTYQDGQSAMKIHVLQGEREKVADCRSLGQFELRGIPPLPAGIARIAVTFAIDADGLLTVSAKETTTGIEQQIAVKPSYGLEFGEIERMVRDSAEHARADISERLLIEARVEAERSAVEVVSAMHADAALLRPGEKDMLESQIARVRKAASGTDRDRIDAERTQLGAMSGPFAERRMNAAISQALEGKRVEDIKG